jgi:NADPH2:quinone reductase
MTSAVGMYLYLGLPQPWTPATTETPLLIYGASSAIGVYAIQLAKRSNIHPLICVAGNAVDYVETLIDRSKGDVVLDYRKGTDALVQGVKTALGGRQLLYSFDAVSDNGSDMPIGKVVSPGAKCVVFLTGRKFPGIPDFAETIHSHVGAVHKDDKDFGLVLFRYFARGLQEGWFKGQRHEVIPGGLGGVQTGLANLKEGKASGVKYAFRIAETEGVGK